MYLAEYPMYTSLTSLQEVGSRASIASNISLGAVAARIQRRQQSLPPPPTPLYLVSRQHLLNNSNYSLNVIPEEAPTPQPPPRRRNKNQRQSYQAPLAQLNPTNRYASMQQLHTTALHTYGFGNSCNFLNCTGNYGRSPLFCL